MQQEGLIRQLVLGITLGIKGQLSVETRFGFVFDPQRVFVVKQRSEYWRLAALSLTDQGVRPSFNRAVFNRRRIMNSELCDKLGGFRERLEEMRGYL